MKASIHKIIICCVLSMLAAACSPDVTLVINNHLVVGQKATIQLTEGGATLLAKSFKLTAADKRVYTPGGGNDVSVTTLSDEQLQFTVPLGITSGDATLEFSTDDDQTFRGTLRIRRVVVMRDLGGKVWILGKTGAGTMEELPSIEAGKGAENLGEGYGKVSVGPGGLLLASSALTSGVIKLAWLGGVTKVSEQSMAVQEPILDLAVAATGQTLVATGPQGSGSDKGGTYLIPRPSSMSDKLTMNPLIKDQHTLAVAVAGVTDSSGKTGRAVALVEQKPGSHKLMFLDLGENSKLGTSHDLALKAGSKYAMAMSADGKYAVVVQSKSSTIYVVHDDTKTVEQVNLSPNEKGPIAVTRGKAGNVFYILNADSGPAPNLSVLTVDSKSAKLGTAIEQVLSKDSKAVGLDASAQDEVVVLGEKSMSLVSPSSSTVSPVTFSTLFSKGERGGSVAIQP